MKNFKFIRNILILVLIFVINFNVWAEESFKPRLAKISVSRAVVYADEYLNTPLGYLPNGKFIYVGNPRVVNQEIVPIVISGRIAYLEVKDIDFQDDETLESNKKNGIVREHNIDIVLKKSEEKLNENNSIFFNFGSFDGGTNLSQIFQTYSNKDLSWVYSFGTFFIHRNPPSKFFWGFGFEYDYAKNNNLEFSSFLIAPSFGYVLNKNTLYGLEAFLNLDISTSTSIKFNNSSFGNANGLVWGPQLGLRAIFTPSTKYKIFSNFSYRLYKAIDLNNISGPNPVSPTTALKYDNFNGISGVSLNFGIGFDL